MDRPGHPGRDVAASRPSGLNSPVAPRTVATTPRIAVVSNGTYFAALGLAPLLHPGSPRREIEVFVTASMRRPSETFWPQTRELLRRWGVRYATYKAGAMLLPVLAQVTRRRPYTLAALARARGFRVRHCSDLNQGDALAALVDFAPDLLISFSCPYRLQPHVLAIPRLGAMNVHASSLPAYAGVCTYVHALANGERAAGITVHAMTQRFDAGPILAQREIAIEPGCSVFELFRRQCRAAGDLLTREVERALTAHRLAGARQDLSRRTYYGEPSADDIRRLRQRGHHLFLESDLRRLWSDAGRVAS